MKCRSLWHRPAATTLTRTSRGPGWATSIASRSSWPGIAGSTAARIGAPAGAVSSRVLAHPRRGMWVAAPPDAGRSGRRITSGFACSTEAARGFDEALELGLDGIAGPARRLGDEVLDLEPVDGPRSVEMAVVRRVEHDDLVAPLAEREDVVWRVVDVEMRLDLGLVAEEAEVAVGDAVGVEPLDGVGDRDGVPPVH